MKATIEQIEFLIVEMKKAKTEHPKAKVYYDWEDSEIRITYPLPRDYGIFNKKDDPNHKKGDYYFEGENTI